MTTDIQSVRTEVDAEIVLHGLPAKTLERLRLKLSLTNPAYARLVRFNNGFTGTEPERIGTAIEMPDGSLHCPRGALDLVREELFKDGLAVSVARDGRRGGNPIAVRPRDYLPPRDYQQEGVNKIRTRLQGLIVLPCGTGKTKLGGYATLDLRVTTLVLVPSVDLATQWIADFTAFGIDAGMVGDGKDERGRDVVVGIVDSVIATLESDPLWGERFGFVLVDECFPAGTRVDGRPIETIRVGDTVTSFDPFEEGTERRFSGHAAKTPLKRRVARTFRKAPEALVRLTFANGRTLVCTPNHKLWTAGSSTCSTRAPDGEKVRTGGWWRRAEHCEGRYVMLSSTQLHEDSLRRVRREDEQASRAESAADLRPVQGQKESGAREGEAVAVRDLSDAGDPDGSRGTRTGANGPGVLFRNAQGRVDAAAPIEDHVRNQPDARVGSDEGIQPDARSSNAREGFDVSPCDGLEASRARRQREGAHCPANTSRVHAGMALRSGGRDGIEAASLQDRRGERSPQDRNRDRRLESLRVDRSGSRPTKGPNPGFTRVDRVEVLERGSDGTFGGVCPDGLVYNLEVEGTHTYFANGVGVSNCHHAPAATFQRALRLLPAKYRIGLTATPDREDGLTRLVQWSFGPVLLERTTKEMIKLGYLMAATIEIVSTGWQWEHNAAYRFATQNDSAKTLQKLLTQLEKDVAEDLLRNCGIADMVARDAKAGETCLVLVRTRDHAKELAEMIVARGVEARALTGKVSKKKRKGAIDDLRGGKLPVVVATSLADEGLDLPRLSAVFLASPQRARGTTVQRLGRLLRLFDKKPKLYDFVDDDVDVLASRATARRRVFKETDLLITESSF